jgi:SPP1 family predicted phage head-tail adaptor
MKPTAAGKRRQHITIQQITTSTDSYGEAVPSPSTFATAYASVRQLTGREIFYAEQVQALATHEVNLRYVAGVTEKMQVAIEGGPALAIVSVNNVEFRNRELILLCVEKK